jgi:hypothetical protein
MPSVIDTRTKQHRDIGDPRLYRRFIRAFEIQTKQGLGIGRSNIAPPLTEIDRHAIQFIDFRVWVGCL